jgi:tRNA dimethylallyltransferase
MAGGSMMYIDAVCDGIDDIPTIDDETRATMKRRLAEEGLQKLREELQRLDPEYYEIVDRQNPKRVVHALEICTMTGRTYTSFRKKERRRQESGVRSQETGDRSQETGDRSQESGNRRDVRPFRIVKIGLNREREELYGRINARVDRMMQQGLLKEAEALFPLREQNALNTVGYKELFDYLDGRWPLEEAVERIKGNTRRYARKQLTWYKKDPQIKWFHPDQKQDIINYILHQEI